MDKEDVFGFYEKLYFHEIDSREKLNARLQIPLMLIVSFVGVLAFLLQNYWHQGFSASAVSFLSLFALSFIALCIAAYYFVRSCFGNEYSFLPDAQSTEEYRQKLCDLYKPYASGTQIASDHFSDYLMSYYIQRSTENTNCNDRRCISLHRTNYALIITAAFTFFSFLSFYLGGLEKADKKFIAQPSTINLITLNGDCMPNETSKNSTPPPPPAPPPPRQIREGVEIVKPRQPLSQSEGKSNDK